MAVVAQGQNIDNQQLQQQQNQQQQQGASPGVSAPQAPQVAQGQVSPSQPQDRQGSGRFTNLQKYISANQGAGQALGEKVQSNIQSQAEAVRQGIQGQQQQFQQKINPQAQFYLNQTPQGQPAQAQQQPAPPTAQDLMTQAYNDPTRFVQNQDAMARFSALRTGQVS